MSLKGKLFFGIALLLMVVFSYLGYISYKISFEKSEANLFQQAERVRSVIMATRRVYHHQFLDSGIPLTKKTVGFLPAHALGKISKDIPNWDDSGFSFNNVSDVPRNPNQQADENEIEAMRFFRENKGEGTYFKPFKNKTGESFYIYARPIWVEEYCLKCHGKRSEAPPTIRELYDTAYDYKVGDLRGILSIKLPASQLMAETWEHAKSDILVYGIILALVYLIIVQVVQYYLTEPLKKLADVMSKFSDEEYYETVEGFNDEFAVIGDSFNKMASRVLEKREALKESRNQIYKINQIFLKFEAEPEKNINSLTALAGEMLNGTCALYNRLENAMLCSVGEWNVPEGYNAKDSPEGHICYDVIKRGSNEPLIVNRLSETVYAESDPNVRLYGLKTYFGQAVRRRSEYVGSICIVYTEDVHPTEEQKKLLGIIAAAIGVEEERKLVEKERNRLVIAVEQADDTVVITDPAGDIVYVNPAFQNITGYSKEEALGKNPRILKSGKHDEIFYKKLWNAISSGEIWQDKIINRKKDGTLYEEEMRITPVKDPNGKIINYVAIKRDITSEGRFARIRDYFSAVTSHEFYTPLSSLRLAEMLLKKYSENKSQSEAAELGKISSVLEESFRRLNRSISSISILSKMTASKVSKEFKPFYLYLTLTDSIKDAKGWMAGEGRKVDIELDAGSFPKEMEINGNEKMIRKALEEAISNAIKYTPDEKKVFISIGKESSNAVIEIKDEGSGIPKEEIDHAFEPFFSLENILLHSSGQYKYKGGGLGLGLTLIRIIMDYHKGKVSLLSDGKNKGSKIVLKLPTLKQEES